MPWRSAAFGGAAWLALAGVWAVGALGLIELLFLLAPLVTVPLGMALIAGDRPTAFLRTARTVQPWAAAAAAASFFVPAGTWAALLAVPWLGVAALVGLEGLSRCFRGGWARFLDTAAMLFLPVGGAWLFISRSGRTDLVMGFPEPIVLLTAVHFHFTAFVGPILAARAGAASSFCPGSRFLFRLSGPGIVLATPLLAVGFVVSERLKLAAVLVLCASFMGVALLSLRALPRLNGRWPRLLLGISGATVIVGMAFAAIFELGSYTGAAWLSIPQMARTHGFLNGVGFGVCGLLAWTVDR